MPRSKNFNTINKLPHGALTVSEYAAKIGCNHSLIYHNITRGKATYEIVVFHDKNFVIPLNKKKSKSTHRVALVHITEDKN